MLIAIKDSLIEKCITELALRTEQSCDDVVEHMLMLCLRDIYNLTVTEKEDITDGEDTCN